MIARSAPEPLFQVPFYCLVCPPLARPSAHKFRRNLPRLLGTKDIACTAIRGPPLPPRIRPRPPGPIPHRSDTIVSDLPPSPAKWTESTQSGFGNLSLHKPIRPSFAARIEHPKHRQQKHIGNCRGIYRYVIALSGAAKSVYRITFRLTRVDEIIVTSSSLRITLTTAPLDIPTRSAISCCFNDWHWR